MLADQEHQGGKWRGRLPDDPLAQHVLAYCHSISSLRSCGFRYRCSATGKEFGKR
jgi:hypothetical protein